MYFFNLDESGARDPQVTVKHADGITEERDPLYVLTAVGLYERHWHAFDRAIGTVRVGGHGRTTINSILDFRPDLKILF
jgi:hypothetical protein